MTQYHQVPASIAMYWSSVIKYQLLLKDIFPSVFFQIVIFSKRIHNVVFSQELLLITTIFQGILPRWFKGLRKVINFRVGTKHRLGYISSFQYADPLQMLNKSFLLQRERFRNSMEYEKPSNDTLKELQRRFALDTELYQFAKQRLLKIHNRIKRRNRNIGR